MKPVKVKGEGKKTARAPKRFSQTGEEADSGLSFPQIFSSAGLQATADPQRASVHVRPGAGPAPAPRADPCHRSPSSPGTAAGLPPPSRRTFCVRSAGIFPSLHSLHGLGKAHPAARPGMLRVQRAEVFLFPSARSAPASVLLRALALTPAPRVLPTQPQRACRWPQGDPVPNISGFPWPGISADPKQGAVVRCCSRFPLGFPPRLEQTR